MAQHTYAQAIDQTIVELEAMKLTITNELAKLDEATLSKRPQPNKWNALECVEHLVQFNLVYMGNMEVALEGKTPPKTSDTWRSGWLGNMMYKRMLPREDGTIPSPIKTFKSLEPRNAPESVSMAGLATLTAQIENLKTQIEDSRELNLEKIKVNSAIGPILKFRLGDVFLIVTAHLARHLLQAKRAAGLIA